MRTSFFERQNAARRSTARLLLLLAPTVVGLVLAVNLIAYATWVILYSWFTDRVPEVGPGFFIIVTTLTVMLMIVGMWEEMRLTARGGELLAESIGARRVDLRTTDLPERRLLNVVEEMAIASGIAVPGVFIMDRESGLNALAAGLSPNEAVIVVTRGLLESVTRDELQGVIGHEFSHILNGDMRLNMRLIGVLGGILVVVLAGKGVLAAGTRKESSNLPMLLLGVVLVGVGSLGAFCARLIKAAVCRQREHLADVSSVVFTRNPDGIAGAIVKMQQAEKRARIAHPGAERASHMFFGEAGDWQRLFATHPPVQERLRAIYGRPVFYQDVARRVSPAPPVQRGVERRTAAVATLAALAGDAGTVANAVGAVGPQHLDYAARLLADLSPPLREALHAAPGAQSAMLGLVLALGGPVRQQQAELLRAAGVDPGPAFATALELQALGKAARLPLVELAIPALKSLPAGERARFVSLLHGLVEADRRVTLEEFVLLAILEGALKDDAGRAAAVKYRSLEPLAEEVRVVLSLVAHAGGAGGAAAFRQALAETGLQLEPIEAAQITLARLRDALARLRELHPLAKPRLVKAAAQAAMADGVLHLGEAELLRAICATLDAPLPPFAAALPPAAALPREALKAG